MANPETKPAEDPNFPEAVRVLLHSLHADAGYLAGRVVRNPEDVNLVVKAVRDKLEKLELAVRLTVSAARRGHWQRPGPVGPDHPLECLVVLPATRQSDGDWYIGGSKFVGQDDVLAWSDAEKSYPDFCPAPEETQRSPAGPHASHRLEPSDAGSYDSKCQRCNNTDVAGNGWGQLAAPCPGDKPA